MGNLSICCLNKIQGVKNPQIEEIITAKEITCGDDHTLILDNEGEIWSFGLNLNGQLGLGNNKNNQKPQKIPKFSNNKIRKICSRGDISFALSETGDCFMWPIKGNKNSEEINCTPRFLPLKEKILSISCGWEFALFLNFNGMVYSMGKSNTYGQLGHGDNLPRLKPTLIEVFYLNNERISQISCGFKHCVAKTFTNKAYSWGLVKNNKIK
jgi:alpha-tubulin suppressor-like RCC1 family protein